MLPAVPRTAVRRGSEINMAKWPANAAPRAVCPPWEMFEQYAKLWELYLKLHGQHKTFKMKNEKENKKTLSEFTMSFLI